MVTMNARVTSKYLADEECNDAETIQQEDEESDGDIEEMFLSFFKVKETLCKGKVWGKNKDIHKLCRWN